MVVDSPVVLAALRFLCASVGLGENLLPLREGAFRKLWSHVAGCLGLLPLGVKPYSLRRGGATWLWRATLSYDAVANRGKWTNLATCRRYVEDSAGHLAGLRFSNWQVEQLHALASVWRSWAVKSLNLEAVGPCSLDGGAYPVLT